MNIEKLQNKDNTSNTRSVFDNDERRSGITSLLLSIKDINLNGKICKTMYTTH